MQNATIGKFPWIKLVMKVLFIKYISQWNEMDKEIVRQSGAGKSEILLFFIFFYIYICLSI